MWSVMKRYWQASSITQMLLGLCMARLLLMACDTVAGTVSRWTCPGVVHLRYGVEAVVKCAPTEFDIISWYRDADYTSNKPPFIYLDPSGKYGPGYDSRKYDLDDNGSLIIANVSLGDDDAFVVTALKESDFSSSQRKLDVTVISGPHNPVYPVVNDSIHQQHVYMDVDRVGTLTCSLYQVHPIVNLTWTVVDPSHVSKIEFSEVETSSTQNEDGTFNVFLVSRYVVEDQFVNRITILCNVDGKIREHFEATKVELLFPIVLFIPAFPTVNGLTSQNHVYIDTERKGALNCTMRNVSPSAHLTWEVVDPAWKEKIIFHSETNRSMNVDGSVDLFLTSTFSVEDDRLKRITIECRVVGATENEYHRNVTTVDLLFPDGPPVPVIDGCYSRQDRCVLKMQRQGELTCSVLRSHQPFDVRWRCDDSLVTFEEGKKFVKNHSESWDVSLLTKYDIHESLDATTISCEVIGWKELIPTAAVTLVLDKAADSRLLTRITATLVFMVIQMTMIICLVCVGVKWMKSALTIRRNQHQIISGQGDTTGHDNGENEELMETGLSEIAGTSGRNSQLSSSVPVSENTEASDVDSGCGTLPRKGREGKIKVHLTEKYQTPVIQEERNEDDHHSFPKKEGMAQK